MSFPKEKKSPMEKKTDGKMKSVASIPDNYVSILQLQERWMKEKEGKQKEIDLEVKQQQQVNGQRRREEEPRVKLERTKSLGGTVHSNRRKKETDCVEKEEADVSAIVSKKGECEGYSRERKKKRSKKKNQVKEVVESGSKAYIRRQINQAKEEIPGVKTVQNTENNNNAASSNSLSLETQFQHLQIRKKRGEEDGRDKEVKGPAKLNSGQGHYRNQKHETRTMVWVKKGDNNAAGGGNGVIF